MNDTRLGCLVIKKDLDKASFFQNFVQWMVVYLSFSGEKKCSGLRISTGFHVIKCGFFRQNFLILSHSIFREHITSFGFRENNKTKTHWVCTDNYLKRGSNSANTRNALKMWHDPKMDLPGPGQNNFFNQSGGRGSLSLFQNHSVTFLFLGVQNSADPSKGVVKVEWFLIKGCTT